MSSPLIDDQGNQVRLTNEVGRGGEGTIFDTSDPDLVAKIYHHTVDTEKSQKLTAMAKAATPDLLRVAAWPVHTLHPVTGGRVVGFLQPKISAHREVHQLYSPVQRRQFFPDTNWAFLLHVAMNCAAAIETVHSAGQVVGDVNQSGILVANTGMVRLIDCDSFQIKTPNHKFRCMVGVPLYTPPELQGVSFRDVDRTTSHDCFGLAVILFQLLFMGRHPFSGRFRGVGEMPIERAISERRFAFSQNAASFQMEPPPHALPIKSLPTQIAQMFEQAFTTNGNGTGRPSAETWRTVLMREKNKLAKCVDDKFHIYHSVLTSCPWCKIEEGGGPSFFSQVTVTQNFDGSFKLTDVWVRICSVRRPQAVEAFVTPPPPRNIRPVPLPIDTQWEKISATIPEPVPPLDTTESLPPIPVLTFEIVPDNPVFVAERLPNVPAWMPDTYVADVHKKFRKSSNRLLRFFSPGSSDFQVAVMDAQKRSVERRCAWEREVARIENERKRIAELNERNERRCVAASEQYDRLRVGLQQRNQERHTRWTQEVLRVENLRRDIAERNVVKQKQWAEYNEKYTRLKAAYDLQAGLIRAAKEKRQAERDRRKMKLSQLMGQMDDLRRTWINESRAMTAEFDQVFRELSCVKGEYEMLRAEFDQRKAELQKDEVQLQQRDHLMSTLIADATISGLGPKRKATLAAYQIETAYDVSYPALSAIRGFGDVIINEIIDWKNSVMRTFRFDANKGIGPSELRTLNMMFHSRRLPKQRELAGGEERLQEIAGRSERRLKELHVLAEGFVVPLAQAEADLSIA